ncbi:MAG: potassium channel family protein [Bacteroidales bacterium]|nr:potassium channel family protein [Bacteroidales bacterium]
MPVIANQQNRLRIAAWCHGIVLVLSLMLVVYISIDTFHGWRLATDSGFMRFQLWICMAFIADFFVELWIAPDRRRFLFHNLVFLLVSIPYLNIITALDIDMPPEAFYYMRFMPLLRGAYVMTRTVGYMSDIRIVSIFWSYVVTLVMALYFGALMFFWREAPVNPQVSTFFDAVWFCATQMTTLGCSIFPVTGAGRILSSMLSMMGMVMFPLFTVYISDILRRHIRKQRAAASSSLDKTATKS